MKHTCGIFLLNEREEILLVHPTHNKWTGTWSIPKGILDEGEDYLSAAIRELYEETSIDLSDKNMICYVLPNIQYKNKDKILHSFLIKGNFDEDIIRCTSFVTPKKGSIFPEVDHYLWINIHNPIIDKFIQEIQLEILNKHIKYRINKYVE